MTDYFKKKYNVETVMTVCEHTFAPVLIIKFNDNSESRVQLTRTQLENVNNIDKYIENIIKDEYYKNKTIQRNIKIKKIINKINGTI